MLLKFQKKMVTADIFNSEFLAGGGNKAPYNH